jgi:hypothetical protein
MNDKQSTPMYAAQPTIASDCLAGASAQAAVPAAVLPVVAVPSPEPWSRVVDTARERWRWITIPDFLATGGRERPLADLVCQRYGIAHADAVRQVRMFLQQHPVAG